MKFNFRSVAFISYLQFLGCCQGRRFGPISSRIRFILYYVQEEVKELLGILLVRATEQNPRIRISTVADSIYVILLKVSVK
jgi:hypothetical protein